MRKGMLMESLHKLNKASELRSSLQHKKDIFGYDLKDRSKHDDIFADLKEKERNEVDGENSGDNSDEEKRELHRKTFAV